MYFLTNKEDLIVAASSNFLSTVGSREICSISSMLHNKLISPDKENNLLNIPNKELSFNYDSTVMHSAFGELTLYTLTNIEKKEETQKDDENIAYLKKIKDGSIAHTDNEYSIPDIQILKKDAEKNIKDSSITPEQNSDKANIEKNLNIDDSIEKLADTIVKEEKKLEPISLADIEENSENLNKIVEKSVDTTKEELEPIELIDTENNTKKLKDEIKDSTIKLSIEDNETQQEKEAKELEINDNEKTQDIENLISIDTENTNENQTVLDNTETVDNVNKKAIDSRLAEIEEFFKDVEEVEQDNNTEVKTDISNDAITNINKPSIDIENNKLIDEKSINFEDEISNEEEDKESTISKLTQKLFPWGKKSNSIELEDKDYEMELKSANELEAPKAPEDEIKASSENLTIEPESNIQELEFDSNQDIIPEDNKDTKESITIEPEQIANIETVDTEKDILDNKIDTEKKFIENKSNLSYKILNTQVNTINLTDNAKKLSIDYSSYKMLLKNYLDEIEKYNNDLLSGSSSTINMLTDAGELLSLNVLTNKLNQLKSEDNRHSTIAEINLISSLIREKLENHKIDKKEIKTDIETPKEITNKEQPNIHIPPIPDELIDITNAKDLLSAINANKIKFDPNRAADELNLPKDLIIEFVEDFLEQSKEHLSVITDAYNKNDLNTIQTTAHMLKGAASNLRLDTIAENLFKLQKENNLENSASLIKQFVANIKGLEQEITSLEDAKNEN